MGFLESEKEHIAPLLPLRTFDPELGNQCVNIF